MLKFMSLNHKTRNTYWQIGRQKLAKNQPVKRINAAEAGFVSTKWM